MGREGVGVQGTSEGARGPDSSRERERGRRLLLLVGGCGGLAAMLRNTNHQQQHCASCGWWQSGKAAKRQSGKVYPG